MFLLRPPYSLRHGPSLERKNICNSQENGVCTRCTAIVNHSAIVNSLRVVNLLRVAFFVRKGPLGLCGTFQPGPLGTPVDGGQERKGSEALHDKRDIHFMTNEISTSRGHLGGRPASKALVRPSVLWKTSMWLRTSMTRTCSVAYCELQLHYTHSKISSESNLIFGYTYIGRKHPSRDAIFSGHNLAPKMPRNISAHDVLEPLKQVLSASRDVTISGQICGSKLQRVFTLGDGCWLPITLTLDIVSELVPKV